MIIARCRYCGKDYSYEGMEDPLSCGGKKCIAAFKSDVFRTEKTSTGTNISPVVFSTGMRRKAKKTEGAKDDVRKSPGRPKKDS